jgi:misacylated tRNA(Ala) deacylase
MTKLLFQTDSYMKSFNAEVLKVDEEMKAFVLDKTAFYPGGGGQLCDNGKILTGNRELPIIKVKKSGDEVYHFTGGELPAVGEQISGQIDWERRHKLMRTHSAMHVLCGVMWKDFGCTVTGGNMDILSARMDFELENLGQDMLPEIERRVNEEIAKEHAILVNILPREEAFEIPDLIRTKINLLPVGIEVIRTIEIVNLDLQADGGTHVANTNEIGKVRVVKFRSKGKINKRLYVEID